MPTTPPNLSWPEHEELPHAKNRPGELAAEAEAAADFEIAELFDDLGGAASTGKKAAKTKSAAAPKFKGPNGELWAGGPGRKPEWVRAVLASGKSIEDFRI